MSIRARLSLSVLACLFAVACDDPTGTGAGPGGPIPGSGVDPDSLAEGDSSPAGEGDGSVSPDAKDPGAGDEQDGGGPSEVSDAGGGDGGAPEPAPGEPEPGEPEPGEPEPGPCTADCDGKGCGPDGCGGSCGSCGPGSVCAEGTCVAGTDPCDPNPCTDPPDSTCQGGQLVTYAAPGSCVDQGGVSACTYEGTNSTCPNGQSCKAGACKPDAAPGEYEFSGDATAMTSLVVAESDCCFDFDGDGQPDNGIGELLDQIGALIGDVDPNTAIDEAIASGDPAILFEEIGLDGAVTDPSLSLAGFLAYDEDDDYSDNLAGTGSFLVQPASFDESGSEPQIFFDTASIAGGQLAAGPGLFTLKLNLGGSPVTLTISEAQLAAGVKTGTNGSGLDMKDGELGGLIPFGQIAGAANSALSLCTCFGLGGAAAFELKDEATMKCTAAFSASKPSCTSGVDPDMCVSIADYKSIACTALGIIKPDIDTDDNGKKDAFSAGLLFQGVSGSIAGIGEDVLGAGGGGCAGAPETSGGVVAWLSLLGLALLAASRRRA